MTERELTRRMLLQDIANKAEATEFILEDHTGEDADANEDADAKELARCLARVGWPGDSNRALRRLERKHSAAVEMLTDLRTGVTT